MSFNVSKAAVYGLTMAVALALGQTIGGTWSREVTLISAIAGGLIGALVFGFLMRDVSLDVAGATPRSVEAAIRGAWALRSFKGVPAADGSVRYTRGLSVLGDAFTVMPTATGVTLTGPANIMAVVKKKAAGR